MPARLPGKRILIVEDNPMLAYDIDDSFRDYGAQIIGPALDLATALRLSREQRPDAAVLDIDLAGDKVWPVARELANRRVPFIFVSSECPAKRPTAFRDIVCLDKPTSTSRILATVAGLVTPPDATQGETENA